MTETDIQRRIQLALSTPHSRIWRNTVGEAWLGRDFTIAKGKLVHGNAYRVTYGLGPGSSDLIGPTSIEITPTMVGRRVAVFTAIEVKLPRALPKTNQKQFIDVITSLGGIANVAHSVEEALEVVNSFKDRC